jgi:hypothetical protein
MMFQQSVVKVSRVWMHQTWRDPRSLAITLGMTGYTQLRINSLQRL